MKLKMAFYGRPERVLEDFCENIFEMHRDVAAKSVRSQKYAVLKSYGNVA